MYATRSLWQATVDPWIAQPLAFDLRTDVCVVGAGIAGLTTAYLLARQGIGVVVLDASRELGGMTARTSAHLASGLDDRYHHLERLFGRNGARQAAESHAAAIDRIEQICRDEGLACDFRRVPGYLFRPPEDRGDELDRELEAARHAGLAVERVGRAPIAAFDTGAALKFADQGQFHPLRYLHGLAEAVQRLGGRIYGDARVLDVGDGRLVRTAGGVTARCDHVLVATGTPVHDRLALHTKQAPYLTYVVAAEIAAGSVETALYWDTADPYHYVRVADGSEADRQRGVQWLVVGGEDHKTGHADDGAQRLRRLEAWLRERFPQAGQVGHAWCGQVYEPADSLGFLGRAPQAGPRGGAKRVYVISGDSGNGLTHGTIGAMIVCDQILGRHNPWEHLYDPRRKTLRALGEFTRENLDVARRYADHLHPSQQDGSRGEVETPEQIPPGQGALLRRGGEHLAVFRDEQGEVYASSAVCRHLGCVVAWNSLDRSWDCPCHGSRFDLLGQVLQGPAHEGLLAATLPHLEQEPSTAKRQVGHETMREQRIRYAVVGLGWISQDAVLPAFANVRETCELVALVSGDDDKLRALGKKYKVDRLVKYEQYDELLQSGEVDAVYIALPNSMHSDFAVRAARAGVHVLCEKPMAVTEQECGEMIRAAREGHVKLMIAYRLHFEEANLAAIELAKSGKLGDLRLFDASFTMDVKEGDIRLDGSLGGGALYDIGIYCINAARYLFRDEPEEVICIPFNNGDPRFAEVDEGFSALLRFPGQRVATFTVSFGAAPVSYFRLIGTKGDLRVEPAFHHTGDLEHFLTVDHKTKHEKYKSRDQFGPELHYFAECILLGRDPEPSGDEGLIDIRIIRACLLSAQQGGKAVPLTEADRLHRPGMEQEIHEPEPSKPGLVKAEAPHRKG